MFFLIHLLVVLDDFEILDIRCIAVVSSKISCSKLSEPLNCIIIVADDLGWSDVSLLGNEINTRSFFILVLYLNLVSLTQGAFI